MAATDTLGSRDKDPSDKVDVGLDWDANDFLSNRTATISSSTWTVPSGLTAVTSSNTTTKTVVRLSGGTANRAYVITNHVVLSNAEEFDRSLEIRVSQR